MMRIRCCALLFLVLAACGRGEGVGMSGTFPSEVCAPDTARWSDGHARYERTATFGDEEADTLLSFAGMAAGGGRLFVLDGAAGTIRVLDDSLRSMGTIGRPGRGAGEFERFVMPTSHGGSHRWVAVQGDTLAVFDGERVSRFRLDGTLLSTWSHDRVRGASPMQSRIAHVAGEVFFTAGGYDPTAGRRQKDFEIHVTRGGQSGIVTSVSVPRLPQSLAMTSEQAQPRWDVHGRCIVLSDGTSPWLVRVDRETGAADTIPLPLPDREPPPIPEEERRAARMAGAQGGLPKPTAPLLVRDLVMDPDGEVWIRPVQPGPALDGVDVLRVSPATGAVRTDTVPAWPLAFGAPGVYYAVEATEDGVPVIVRYDAAR